MLVISPHLDDAVLSCGCWLAAHAGSMVITVFAGVPREAQAQTERDARCGFASAEEAMTARRREDRAALALLEARPVWLEFCDSQYGQTPSVGDVSGALPRTFMAGAAVMRTQAYREVGGYEPRFFLGAEEWLMGPDLAVRGWRMVHAHDVVTHHHPSVARDPKARRIAQARNKLWIAWMRLPLASACRESLHVLRDAARFGLMQPALRQALAGLPWALRRRSVLPERVHQMYRRVFREPTS